MAKPKAVQASTKQPTFADCEASSWWYEDDGGAWKPDITSMDGELRRDALDFMERVRQWWAIQRDPDEAEARKAYASRAAQYLTTIYPNVRVNAGAYGEAAGEELGRYSADIVKQVAERARRTCKTLPSIAQLVEWARTESDRRDVQYRAFQGAMSEYDAAIKRGQDQAREVIVKGGLADRLTLESLDNFHRGLTYYSLGIPASQDEVAPGYCLPNHVSKANALYRLIIQRHQGAADWLVEAVREGERLHAVVSAGGGWNTHPNAWHDFMADCRDRLVTLLTEAGNPARARPEAICTPPVTKAPLRPPSATGERVTHGKFGPGTVIARDEDKVEVAFDAWGVKRILDRFLSPASEHSHNPPVEVNE